MDKFWENYIKTRPSDSKGAFDAFKKMNQEPRTGFKDGNGVYDEKELLGKRVNELMDEGYDFGEAVKQAMREGYAKGGRIGFYGGSAVSLIGAGYNLAKPLINPLIKKYFPEIGGLISSAILALRDRGIIAPDADEIEKEAQRIREMNKPLSSPAEPPIKIDTTTGSPPPKIEKQKPPVTGDIILPPQTGGSEIAETKKEDLIFTSQTAEDVAEDVDEETVMTEKDIIDLKEKFKNKGWRDTTIITGAGETRKSIPQRTNLPFLEAFNKYSKQFHDGNLREAIREIGGFTKTVGKRDNQLESFYTTIQSAAKRSGFKFDTSSDKLTSNIPQSKVPVTIVELTTQLRTNPGIIDNRIKELNIDLDKVYNRKELQDILGVKRGNRRQDNFFFEILKDQGLEYKKLPGGKVGFTANEAIEAFKTYAKNKLRNYESRSFSGTLKKKSTENYNLRIKIDGKDFAKFNRNLNKRIDRIMKQEDLYFPNSAAEVGHNPVPIAFTEKIEMLNDPALANKIYSLQNYTWQGREINYDTLAYTSGTLEKALKKLDKYYGQEVTKTNIGDIETAIDEVHAYFNSVIKKGGEMVKNLPFHKDVIGKLEITTPQIGDILTAENFNVDMSDVDKRHIIGNIDIINPGVVKYKDLSPKERIMYGQNVLDQKIEQIKQFYGPDGANYPPDIIEDFITKLEIGRPDKANPIIGLAETKGFGYSTGGRIGYGGGYLVGGAKKLFDKSIPKDKYSRQMMGLISGEEGIYEILSLLNQMGLFADGGRAGYMGGGITAIRKPHAIPPERQGLRSIMINGKKS
jgi:hypothetical protein